MSSSICLFFILSWIFLSKSEDCDSKITHCLKCVDSFLLCDKCEDGFYNLAGECMKNCPHQSTAMIIDGEGFCICDANTWVDEINDQCALCHPNCQTCYGPRESQCGLNGKEQKMFITNKIFMMES